MSQVNFAASLFPELNLGTTNAKGRIKEYYDDFKSEMARLLGVLADYSQPLTLNGHTIPPELRGGAGETWLLEEWREQNLFVFSQLLESAKFEQTLDKQINNISFT